MNESLTQVKFIAIAKVISRLNGRHFPLLILRKDGQMRNVLIPALLDSQRLDLVTIRSLRIDIFLPSRAAVDTGNGYKCEHIHEAAGQENTRLTLSLALSHTSPLIKAFFVEVLSTGCFAPDQWLVGLEIHDTDGALAVCRFAFAIIRFDLVGSLRCYWCFGDGRLRKDRLEFLREEAKLVAHIHWCFENHNERILNISPGRALKTTLKITLKITLKDHTYN